ncbi:MAG: hypothetical protein LBT01_08330 [Spirochaetaceae bacterium]|jgi:hypothetical protein|nr:hypothetical protein [Spirochaetaceae bacterium]
MLEEQNPFGSPESPANPVEPESIRLSGMMLSHLKGASPWIRFMGILGFIGGGAMGLLGIIILVSGGALATVANTEFFGVLSAFGGFIYIGIGALYFFPSLFAYRFGVCLKHYCLTYNNSELEKAFKNNYALWKFLGVLTIVCIGLVVSIIPIGIIIGVAGMLSL